MSRFVFRPIAAFGLLGIVALVVGAQAPAPVPTPQDEKTARRVVSILESSHMAIVAFFRIRAVAIKWFVHGVVCW